MTQDLSIIILAAGRGTRMKSNLPKVMHKVANREMLNMVIDEAKSLNPKNVTIVISDEMTGVEDLVTKSHPEIAISFAIQKERLGTGHAVSCALENITDIGQKVLVLYGDTPLIEKETLRKMQNKLDDFALAILGFENFAQNAYGRLVINGDRLEKIVEFKDANEEEKTISLCNSGVIAISGDKITELLAQIDNKNAAGEFYLTDIVKIANENGLNSSFIITNEEEVLGVNSRLELARVEKIKQRKIAQKMMENGVTLLDPESIYFSFDSEISNDVIIHPNVFFGPKVKIASNVEIKSFSHIEGAQIAQNAVIGPFARLRPGSKLDENVKIGNFVEVKNSQIGQKSKINHLSYIGDCDLGKNSNIGAGTITCNYDGYNKFKTNIGDDVFIGSNSSLIAPLNIENGALVAAGSVITKNISQDDLAVARAKQINLEKGGEKFRNNKSNNKND